MTAIPICDTLTITAKTNGAKGVVTITGGGTGLTYKPNANANGADTFTYTIADGHGWTTIGTVNVTITPVQDPPNAVNDATLSVRESAGATALAVKANDSDPDGDTLTIVAKTNGAHGTVAITGGGTGLTYDPVNLYYGTDVFTYTLSDGHGGTDSATVLLTITKDTTKPVAIAPIESFYSPDGRHELDEGSYRLVRHRHERDRDRQVPAPGQHERRELRDGEPGQRDLDLREPDPDRRPELPLPGPCDRQAGQRGQLRLRADVQARSLPEHELRRPLHGNLDDELQRSSASGGSHRSTTSTGARARITDDARATSPGSPPGPRPAGPRRSGSTASWPRPSTCAARRRSTASSSSHATSRRSARTRSRCGRPAAGGSTWTPSSSTAEAGAAMPRARGTCYTAAAVSGRP